MRRGWVALAAVVLVLGTVACSSDDGGEAVEDTTTTTTEVADAASSSDDAGGDATAPCDAVNDLTDPDASSTALNAAVDAFKATGSAPDATAGVTYQQTSCVDGELHLTVVGDGVDPQLLVFTWDGSDATFEEAADAATACAGELEDLEAQILGC
jgi:hypothetical protein